MVDVIQSTRTEALELLGLRGGGELEELEGAQRSLQWGGSLKMPCNSQLINMEWQFFVSLPS